MRFVEIKSTELQSVLLAHQVRSQLIRQRTQTANALRSHCAEFGAVYRKGIRHVYGICEMVRKREDRRIPSQAYLVLSVLVDQFESLGQAIDEAEAQIRAYFKCSEDCQRLAAVPGIGILSATALVATIGDAGQFRSGRHLAAWLGLVPRQHSSDEKRTLLGISKRGNRYL